VVPENAEGRGSALMKHVLMVAYYFPPIAATGAMRPLNFCRHLPSYGWMPSVLATDHPSALPPQASDADLLQHVPAEIEVIRVQHGNPLGRLLAYRDWLKRMLNRKASVISSQAARAGDAVSNYGADRQESAFAKARRFVFDAWLHFPDPQSRWYEPAVRAVVGRSAAKRADVILATGGPWTSLLVGKRLAQQWAVPFVADFRDPWVGRHELFSSTLLHRRAARLERSVCEAASRVILNTEELRVRFCEQYPQWQTKFVAITNGYPQEMALHPVIDDASANPPSVLEFSHFGTVYGNRSPLALFQAVHALMSEGALDHTRLTLRFVGAWDVDDPTCNQLAKSLEECGVLQRVSPIPHQACLKEMVKSDVLLILQPDYPFQVPAKIYEYMTAGRPLFVLGGEGATANLVHRHRLGRCCPNRVSEAKRTLMELMNDRTSLTPPNPADTEQFSYAVLSKRLADLLDNAIREKIR
jgi:glycosyltransferase involved in cell wall biosynthesis